MRYPGTNDACICIDSTDGRIVILHNVRFTKGDFTLSTKLVSSANNEKRSNNGTLTNATTLTPVKDVTQVDNDLDTNRVQEKVAVSCEPDTSNKIEVMQINMSNSSIKRKIGMNKYHLEVPTRDLEMGINSQNREKRKLIHSFQ